MSARTQAERSASTRGRLMAATVESLVERGYHATSTVDICRRAGVSRGALLHQYPTKGALVASTVEHLFEQMHEQFRDVLRAATDRQDTLDGAYEKMWEIYTGPTLVAWQELLTAARTDPALRRVCVRFNRRFVDEAESTFRDLFRVPDEVPVRAAVRLAFAVYDGLAQNRIVEDDENLFEETRALFKALMSQWSVQ